LLTDADSAFDRHVTITRY